MLMETPPSKEKKLENAWYKDVQTMILYPQGNSNPRFFREREMSWASRRWGLIFLDSLYEKEAHVNGARYRACGGEALGLTSLEKKVEGSHKQRDAQVFRYTWALEE